MTATLYGNESLLKYILDNKVELNVPDSETGWTPLMLAAATNQKNIVRLLLKHGAQIEAKNALHMNVHQLAQPGIFENRLPLDKTVDKTRLFLMACKNDATEEAKRYLEQNIGKKGHFLKRNSASFFLWGRIGILLARVARSLF